MDSASSSRDFSTAEIIFSTCGLLGREKIKRGNCSCVALKTLIRPTRRDAGARPSLQQQSCQNLFNLWGKALNTLGRSSLWPAQQCRLCQVSMFLLRSAETSNNASCKAHDISGVTRLLESRSTMLRPRTTGRPASESGSRIEVTL